MKISPVLPVALSSLLTISLAAPLRLRYPTPAEAEKRADTFLQPKAANFDEQIHQTLDFGTGEPLLVRDLQKAKRVDAVSHSSSSSDDSSASIAPSSGSTSALDGTGKTSFDEAIHETLDFGGDTDPLLFKKDAESQPEKRATDSLDTTIHEDLDFGGVTDPLLFKKDAVEKRATSLPTSTESEDSAFDNSIHDDLDFGGTTDPLLGGSGQTLSFFRRAEEAAKGTAEKVARAFQA